MKRVRRTSARALVLRVKSADSLTGNGAENNGNEEK